MAGLQKQEIALWPCRSTSIYVERACLVLICSVSWKSSQLTAVSIIFHIPGTDYRLKFWFLCVTLCALGNCSLVLPVKIWHGFDLFTTKSFPVDPNGFGEKSVQAQLSQGSFYWWSGQRQMAVTQEDLPDFCEWTKPCTWPPASLLLVPPPRRPAWWVPLAVIRKPAPTPLNDTNTARFLEPRSDCSDDCSCQTWPNLAEQTFIRE